MANSPSPPREPRCHTSSGSSPKGGSPKTMLRRSWTLRSGGIFLPARHALFFYRGIGFFFDAGVVTEASRWADKIMSALALDQHVEVHVGPPDAVIHGTEYRQERLGTIESVTADRRTTQSSGRASRAADRERSAYRKPFWKTGSRQSDQRSWSR